jgi:hypothetical protein
MTGLQDLTIEEKTKLVFALIFFILGTLLSISGFLMR